jgi:hypothetical protein
MLDGQSQERTQSIGILRVEDSGGARGEDKIEGHIGIRYDVSDRAGKKPRQVECGEEDPMRLTLGASHVQLVVQHILAQGSITGGIRLDGECDKPHGGEVTAKFDRPETRGECFLFLESSGS